MISYNTLRKNKTLSQVISNEDAQDEKPKKETAKD